MAGASIETVTDRLERLDERTQRIESKLDALLTRFRISTDPKVVADSGDIARVLATGNSPVPALSPSFARTSSLVTAGEATAVAQPLRYSKVANVTQENQPSAPANGPFVYEALASDNAEIRVLGLHGSNNEDDPIVCEIQNVTLDPDREPITARSVDRFKSLSARKLSRGPKYQALSYTWGTPNKTGSIVLNGHHFPITKNLEAALRQLRQIQANTVPRTSWWIDAICINQDDILERNSQVSLMRRIYKKAQQVSVWLGEEADDSSFALDSILKITSPPKRGPGEANAQAPVISSEEKLRCWKALWAFYQRPWFERAWIRQEVAISKSQTVYCGSHSCHLHTLANATNILHYIYNDMKYQPLPPVKSGLMSPPYVNLKLLWDLHLEIRMNEQYVQLERLLTQARGCRATDLRDKVFSVLGMADPEVYPVKPDYRTPLDQIFLSTTRCVIEASKRLDILSSCQNPDSTDFPSWVPNFAQEWKRSPFKAIPERHKPSEAEAEFSFDGNALCVKGDFIDHVQFICEDYVKLDDTDDKLDHLLAQWKRFVIDVGKPHKDRHTTEKRLLEGLAEPQSGESWLKFISAEEDMGWGLKSSQEGELLPQDLTRVPHTYDVQHLKNLLVADNFNNQIKPYAKFYEYLKKYGVGRRLCLSKSFVIGLVPAEAEIGDIFTIIHGASFPFVLRARGEAHTLIGEACMFERA